MINNETFPDMQPDTPHARQQWRIDILRLADEAVMKGYPMVAIEILKEGFRTLSIQYVVAESEVQTLQLTDEEQKKLIEVAKKSIEDLFGFGAKTPTTGNEQS
jgi:hypothetical protein